MTQWPCQNDNGSTCAASSKIWDIVVIGAGPAGSLIARQLAKLGSSVLLLDKSRFPRTKVCGCCLSTTALEILERAGLGALTARLGAISLHGMHLASEGRSVDVDLPGGVSVSRDSFDAALVAEAVSAGVTFLGEISAQIRPTIGQFRTIVLSSNKSCGDVSARIVVDASGLGSGLLRHQPGLQSLVQHNSRIGAGAVLRSAPSSYRRGIVYMAIASEGYVGLVRLQNDTVDIAAALDASYIRGCRSIDHAAAQILASAGLSALPLTDLAWRGTPRLTQRLNRVADDRIFAIGDAAGYVEPFTGEGIGWALASAWYAAPLIHDAVCGDCPQQERRWNLLHHNLLHRRLRMCGWVAAALRRRSLRTAALRTLEMAPKVARPFVRRLHAPARLD